MLIGSSVGARVSTILRTSLVARSTPNTLYKAKREPVCAINARLQSVWYSTADGTNDPATPTLRQTLTKALLQNKPQEVWTLFRRITHSLEWHMLTEDEICRTVRVFNNQFIFEHTTDALMRANIIVKLCQEREVKTATTAFYNECIRLNVYMNKRDMACEIKENMDAGVYGVDVKPDIYTYTSIFSDVNATTSEDLAQLVELYDEMLSRGIQPTELVKKPLIKLARQVGEHRLLKALLESPDTEKLTTLHGTTAARMLSNRAQAHIAQYDIDTAKAQLEELLIYHIPKDTRPIPFSPGYASGSSDIKIPLRFTRTREAFFIYTRSLYESIMRIYLIRRRANDARELLDDMRRTIYLPPTRMAYNWFIRFHAKRKNIQKLHEIHDMMLQDGVMPDEYAYTKFITSCMYHPNAQRLQKLVDTAARRSILDAPEKADSGHVLSTRLDEPDEGVQRSGLPDVPRHIMELANIHNIVYHPQACTRFYKSMFLEHEADIDDLRSEKCQPNAHIINAVMCAYTMLEKPVLVLREFQRFVRHQHRLSPHQAPSDLMKSIVPVAHIFKMALDAARVINNQWMVRKILAQMDVWEVRLPNPVTKEAL
ncbi:hypothetical protein IW147_000929 [Coemansia sp. RSA 720]|nr:hypothetical protein LPJ76_005019 [Coemansia sp. RSA 638]KAJ2125283.1 hypothetical protein IW147_000929 [Coemansia sp. RSA 720]KAJ2545639.1 hypothetical protein GGF49_000148 [Coemansia sp. RSA 1853]